MAMLLPCPIRGAASTVKLRELWHYLKAKPLFAVSLLFALDSAVWVLMAVVPGPSPDWVTQLIVGVSALIMIISASAQEDKLLPAMLARTMLVAGILLFAIGVLLNGDGDWHKGALFVGTTAVTMCGVLLHARWKERHEEKPSEEPAVENDEECQPVEHQLTK